MVQKTAVGCVMERSEVMAWATGLFFGLALTAGGIIALMESVVLP
jgi:hypothetical protein